MKISDAIRKWCDLAEADSFPCDELRELADRIDNEMVELPKDRDGVPIRVGDTVYLLNGNTYNVKEISILSQTAYPTCEAPDGKTYEFLPGGLSHERPDSFERIADELEVAKGWCDQNGEHSCIVSSVSTKTLQEWADRIRKLAKEDE